jgi:hypothetical protein
MNHRGKGVKIRPALMVLAVLAASPAWSQQPSPEQVSAIRSSCRADFMSRCTGVTPGGAEAFACLQKNVAQLSPACQTAVNAAAPKPATAAAPPPAAPPAAAAPVRAATPAAPPPPLAPATASAAAPAAATAASPPANVPSSDQVAAIRSACPSDFAALCAGVPPGGLEGLSCLQRNAGKLSAACRFAVTTSTGAAATAAPPAPARVRVAAPPPAVAPVAPAAAPARTVATAPAAAPAMPAARPSAEQQAAIRASCRADFMSRCAGVQPGGADALACLKRNATQLSAPCRNAVSAIGGAAPAATASAATVAAATPAAPSPDQQAAIKSACQRDFMMNCRGVQPGGQDAFMCLQRNSARLSPACQGALAAVASGSAPATSTAAAAPPAARPPAGHSRCAAPSASG